MGPETLRN